MTPRRSPSDRRDGGLTLVELIVTMAIASVILIIIGGFFVSSILSERVIRTVSITASEVQSSVRLITSAVNSSSHIQLTNPSGDDQFLVVRTAGGGATESWSCVGWYFDAEGGLLRQSTWPIGDVDGAPSGETLETWTLLMSGIAPRLSDGIFALSGSEVEVGFDVEADGRTVRIDTAAARPGYVAAEPGVGDACF